MLQKIEKMQKALFYKEWLKVRWFFLLAMLASWGFVGYGLLRINRVVTMKGAAHVWEVMLERDVVFIDGLTYVPLIIGILMALVQFVPEMQQSRLKLALHLPCGQYRTIVSMLLFSCLLLLACFASNLIIMGSYLSNILAYELTMRILLTALTWYVAGLAGYLLTAWMCLEPTWKRRIFNLLVSAGVLRIFFLSSFPEAYNGFLLLLAVYSLLFIFLPLLSVHRFKTGKQD